jgi:hypothetical protein
LGLILTVGGIMVLGVFSPIYNWLLEIASTSGIGLWFVG